MAASPKIEAPGGFSENTAGRMNTFRQAEVVPLFFGRARIAVKWSTPVLNWYTRSTKTSAYGFFSGVGTIAHGPIDEIIQIIVNGKPYNGIFKFRSDYPGTEYIDHVLNKETPETFRTWWGLETQSTLGAFINFLDVGGILGPYHSESRGIAKLGIHNMEAGQVSGGRMPPVPNVEMEVYRRSPAAYSFGYAAHGTHPIGAIKDFLTNKRGGLGIPAAHFDSTHWTDAMTRLMTDGVAGRSGTDLFISPVLTSKKEAAAVIADCLSYIDGWLRWKNGKIEIDWYPNDGSDPGEVREISQHDIIGEPQIDAQGLDKLATLVAVTGLDWQSPDSPLSEIVEVAQIPYAAQLIGEPRVEQIQRPFYTWRDQIRSHANVLGIIKANPDLTGSFKIPRASATLPDNVTPLAPGDRFQFDYAPYELDILCRVIGRTNSPDKAEVTIKFQRERGASAQPYVPALDPRADTTSPDAPALTRYTVTEVPAIEPRAVAVLVERPATGNALGIKAHYAPTNSWPGTVLETFSTWSVGAVLQTNLTAITSSTTVNVNAVGSDWGRILSQTAAQQADDRLLMIAGAEWFSVGAVGVVGSGVYSIAVTRARQGSAATTHAVSDSVYFCYRADLPTITHPEFVDAATRWFKFQSYNVAGDGALTSAVPYTFPTRGPATPSGLVATGQPLAISLTWTPPLESAHVVTTQIFERTTATPAPVINDPPEFTVAGAASSFLRPGLAAGAVRYYWLLYKDNNGRFSAMSASANATAGTSVGAAPSNPSAASKTTQGCTISPDGVAHSWFKFSIPGLPANASSLAVLRRVDVTQEYQAVAFLTNTSTALWRDDIGLVPGVAYDYATQAHGAGGSSGIVDMTATPFSATGPASPPAAPSGLAATAYPGSNQLNWTASSDTYVATYEVVRNTSNTTSGAASMGRADGTGLRDPTAVPGTLYYYFVRSIGKDGTAGSYSASVSVTTAAAAFTASVPANATAASKTSGGVTISDDGTVFAYMVFSIPAPPLLAVGVDILYRVNTSAEWTIARTVYDTSATSYQKDGLEPGAVYAWATQAWSAAGASSVIPMTGSPFTANVKVTGPAAPSGISVTAFPGWNEIFWALSSDPTVVTYIIYRFPTNSSGSAIEIGRLMGDHLNDSAPSAGSTQWYWVAAVDASGNVGSKSPGQSVTTATKPALTTLPSTASAASKTSQGNYDSTDGQSKAYFVMSIPAMPAGAVGQRIRVSTNSSANGAIRGDLSNTSTATLYIDDLTPGVAYYVTTEPYSAGGPQTATSATASPFTAPSKTTCNPPTSPAMTTSSSYMQKVPVSYTGAGGAPKWAAGVLTWTASPDADVEFYELQFVLSGVIFDRTAGTETSRHYYSWQSSNPSSDDVKVRAVNRSGVRSTFAQTTQGFLSLTTAYGPGSVAEDNRDDVRVSGVKTGDTSASSVRKVLCRYPVQGSVTLTGGTPTETWNISLSNAGFSTKPDVALITFLSFTVEAKYLRTDAASTSTNARMLAGIDLVANVPAATIEYQIEFIEYD